MLALTESEIIGISGSFKAWFGLIVKHGVLHMPNQPNGYAVRIGAFALSHFSRYA